MVKNKSGFFFIFLIYFFLIIAIFNLELFYPDLIGNKKIYKAFAIIIFFIITVVFVLLNKRFLLTTGISSDKVDINRNLSEGGRNEIISSVKENKRESEDKNFIRVNYEKILNEVDTFVLVVDAKLNPVYINEFGKNRLGNLYDIDNLLIEHFAGEDFIKELESNKKNTFNLETIIKVAGKKKITVSVSVSRLVDEMRAFSGMVILFNDISKQKRAELSLNNQINFSKQIFKTIPDVILITDMDLRVIFANNKAEYILAKNNNENRKIFNYLSQNAIENGFDEYLRQIITRGVTDKQINVQNPFMSEGGFVDIEIVPLKSGGKIIGGLLLVKDITEWINLTDELKNLENFNRKMINSSPYVIISVNEDDIVSGWNERGEEKFGIKADEIIGKNLFKTFTTLNIIRDEVNEVKIIGEPTFLSDKEIELADGKKLAVEITLYPVYSKENNIVINIRDISELKKLENSLIHANKMGSLGLLTSKIVHDLNNVLSGITGYTTLLDKKVKQDSEIRKYINRLIASSDRATEIIKQTLSFSKSNKKKDELININELIEESAKLLKLRIGNSKVSLNLSDKSLTTKGCKTRFSQAIINLLVNANDALLTTDKPEIIIKTLFRKESTADKIIISISDNGTGIKEDIINNIFDTYFTTKTEDKGTGLGLSNVKEIIEDFDGTIEVKSNYGEGAEFILTLPWSDEGKMKEKKMKLSEKKELFISGKVLLVDDEEAVREIGSEILELLGVNCITAVDGDDGIIKFEENIDDIELVILDVEMPKKQGNEVYDFIKSAKPDMKILIASGYSKEYLEKEIFRNTISEYIAKPFQLNELGAKLRDMVN
jgi:PAS domain S-box-containing protein